MKQIVYSIILLHILKIPMVLYSDTMIQSNEKYFLKIMVAEYDQLIDQWDEKRFTRYVSRDSSLSDKDAIVYTLPINGKTMSKDFDAFIMYKQDNQYQVDGIGLCAELEMISCDEESITFKQSLDLVSPQGFESLPSGGEINIVPILKSISLKIESRLFFDKYLIIGSNDNLFDFCFWLEKADVSQMEPEKTFDIPFN